LKRVILWYSRRNVLLYSCKFGALIDIRLSSYIKIVQLSRKNRENKNVSRAILTEHFNISNIFSFILFRPRSKGEYLFVIGQLFFGLLLFATVLGHVANIVTSVSAARKEFQGELINHFLVCVSLCISSQVVL